MPPSANQAALEPDLLFINVTSPAHVLFCVSHPQ